MNSLRVRAALLTVLVMVAVACGGGGATADPAGSVKAAFDTVASGGLAKFDDFACAAQKGKVAEAFTGAAGGGFSQAGINMTDVMNAMTVKFDNVSAKEVSKTDTKATVHVSGTMTVTVDQEKFKPILKQMMTAQGLPADDATINAALSAMSGQLTKSQALDQDVVVVNENGKWLICS